VQESPEKQAPESRRLAKALGCSVGQKMQPVKKAKIFEGVEKETFLSHH